MDSPNGSLTCNAGVFLKRLLLLSEGILSYKKQTMKKNSYCFSEDQELNGTGIQERY